MRAENPPLPIDHHLGENTEASSQIIVCRFTPAETSALLHKLPPGVRTQELLLAALSEALAQWTGRNEFTIETEGHGREESALKTFAHLSATPDLSRTIGWFTTIFPIRLRRASTASATLDSVVRWLRAVPHHGFGYSLLRMSSRAEVLFNYLGQFDQTVAGLEHFAFSDAPTGPWHAPAARRTHVLELNALVIHGALEVRFAFSTNLHSRTTIETLAAQFTSTARSLAALKYPLARLAETALAELATRHPALEDVYPLSSMQRLFLAVEAAQPGSGTDQWHCRLLGPLDAHALRTAWQQVSQRHPALRTGYLVEASEPHQFVVRDAPPPWLFEDISVLPHEDRCKYFAQRLREDSARPFDLAFPPLTRIALYRVSAEEHWFVWTHHHLEIDGWSWPLVFRDLSLALNQQLVEAAPAPPYRDFIAWLAMRDEGRAESFWRAKLGGFRAPTPLPVTRTAGPEFECTGGFDATALNATARRLQVTVSVIVQCAWAALLARHGGTADVVFGAAFSGRPADLAGSDRIVGHFVNNLPVRVRLESGSTLATAASALHQTLAQLTEHQATPLADIQSWSELPWNARLFETLVVFQNYITDGAAQTLGSMTIADFHAPVRTNYPLTLVVQPGSELRVTLVANANVASSDVVRALAAQLCTLIKSAVATPDQPLATLTATLADLRTTPAIAAVSASPPAPTTSRMEAQIAEIWAEAFGRAVSTSDNFFDLGGHSLLMLRVHARLVLALKREIPVVKLFQHPTITALARFLGGETGAPNVALAAQDRAAKARAALARRPVSIRTNL